MSATNLCIALALVAPTSFCAESLRAPVIEWQQTIGGTADDWPTKVVEMPDGSFAIGGVSYSGISGNKASPLRDTDFRPTDMDEVGDAWLVMLNASGVKQWDCSYGGIGGDALVEIAPTSDGGLLVGGTAFRGEAIPVPDQLEPWAYLVGSKDYFVARNDAFGHLLWQQFLGGDKSEFLAGLTIGIDNNVTLAGNSLSVPGGNRMAPHFGDYDAWIARLDPAGNRIWDRSFGGVSADQLGLAQKTSDGGMILCGVTHSLPSGNKTSPAYGQGDVWLLRLNSAGERLWEQSLGGTAYEAPVKLIEMPDGSFLIACGSASPVSGNKTSPSLDSNPGLPGDFWIVRVNADGVVLWDKTFGTARSWEFLLDLQPTASGGAILGGVSFTDLAPIDSFVPEFRLIAIDTNGTELWSKVFDTANTSAVGWVYSRFLVLPDEGVLIGTTSFARGTNSLKTSPTYGLADCWLLRLDSRGNPVWDLSLAGGGLDFSATLDKCRDGGFIVGIASESVGSVPSGNKSHAGYGGSDFWIVKLSPELQPDSDGDGVRDDLDQCPNTPVDAIVNASGCSIDQLVPCDGPWKNHGEYVSAVRSVTAQFRNSRLLTPEQCHSIFAQAVGSRCGERDNSDDKRPNVRTF